MESSSSVTEWIDRLKQGDMEVADKLWNRYVGDLIRLAHRRLGRRPRRVVDEEDIVANAFASFFERAKDDRFDKLDDRDDLWKLLAEITEHKVLDQFRRDGAKKRGEGRVRGESVLGGVDSQGQRAGADWYAGHEPTPAFAAEFAESLRRKLDALDDDKTRAVAIDLMAGFKNAEIAERQEISLRSVERKRSFIRRVWKEEE